MKKELTKLPGYQENELGDDKLMSRMVGMLAIAQLDASLLKGETIVVPSLNIKISEALGTSPDEIKTDSV